MSTCSTGAVSLGIQTTDQRSIVGKTVQFCVVRARAPCTPTGRQDDGCDNAVTMLIVGFRVDDREDWVPAESRGLGRGQEREGGLLRVARASDGHVMVPVLGKS